MHQQKFEQYFDDQPFELGVTDDEQVQDFQSRGGGESLLAQAEVFDEVECRDRPTRAERAEGRQLRVRDMWKLAY